MTVPRVFGIDDFALRRGLGHATVLIDADTPGLADRRPDARLRARLQPGRGRLVGHESSLGNLGSCSTRGQLAAIIKNRLKSIHYRPAQIDGLLAQTGLSLQPEPP